MKKIYLVGVMALTLLLSCKSKADKSGTTSDADSTAVKTTTETETKTTEPVGNAPKTYVVTFSPDSAVLGKHLEAAIKVLPGTATELSDPDGKAQGIELSFKMSLTNRTKIGGNTIGVSPSDFRILVDNNSSISQLNGSYLSAEPESTKESENITYRLPAGTKPKSLKLFYDETRASVDINLK